MKKWRHEEIQNNDELKSKQQKMYVKSERKIEWELYEKEGQRHQKLQVLHAGQKLTSKYPRLLEYEEK